MSGGRVSGSGFNASTLNHVNLKPPDGEEAIAEDAWAVELLQRYQEHQDGATTGDNRRNSPRYA